MILPVTMPPARTREQRLLDTRSRLEADVDAWVATTDPDGQPRLVPLSFLWDGTHIVLSTSVRGPGGRNLAATGQVRLGIGTTRDVVHVEGVVDAVRRGDEMATDVLDAFAAKTGFDPRASDAYRYFLVRPVRIRAWREENELRDSVIMSDGAWPT
jgi:hypothetical protein